MLVDEIKARMFKAMKAGSIVEKEILRTALGEITTEAARAGRLGSDEEATAVLRKLIKSNEESLTASENENQKQTLRQEIEVLLTFLPRSLSQAEIVEALTPALSAIQSAGSEGQAMGVAMKHLKATGAVVQAKEVSSAVQQIRSKS